MSLTLGSGPFGARGGRWSFAPAEHVWYLEEWPRRMRAVLGDQTVLDTRRAKVLHESGAFLAHYIPLADVRQDLLVSRDAAGMDEHKGPVQRFDVRVGDRVAQEAVTAYPEPPAGAPPLGDHVVVEFGAMDRWFEEDDPIYSHPRDPYHRVDVRASSRHVIVNHRDQVIAESTRPKLLFETGNPVRYYLPVADVRIDLLERSDTISECPYKGDGQHWHLVIDGERVDDAAWSLPHPLPEGIAAAEHVCFYPSKVDVSVDGEPADDFGPF
ncbi:MAG: DUF427 domain-containing protein [Actinomycetota bacterium]|nr:DUF427 domain-containing protein [Actinomycetota bacterium]